MVAVVEMAEDEDFEEEAESEGAGKASRSPDGKEPVMAVKAAAR